MSLTILADHGQNNVVEKKGANVHLKWKTYFCFLGWYFLLSTVVVVLYS